MLRCPDENLWDELTVETMKYLSRSTSKLEIAFVALTVISAADLSAIAYRGSFVLPESTKLLWQLLSATIWVCWVRADRRGREFRAPFEFDAFVFFAWPIVVPYYLCQTRGWRGLLLVLAMGGLVIAPAVVAAFAFVAGR
jgi:hypothetical protein